MTDPLTALLRRGMAVLRAGAETSGNGPCSDGGVRCRWDAVAERMVGEGADQGRGVEVATKEALQALGTHLTEGSGLGT